MRNRHHHITLLFTLVLVFLASAAFGEEAQAQWKIHNPYQRVEWTTYERHKANLHTHTTESDGKLSPAEVIDVYHELGYGILALTDHNRVTWPWEDFGRDPGALKMIAVQGAEPSRHHHMGSYFCDVSGGRRGQQVVDTLAEVRAQDGLAVMFHPTRYDWPAEDYVKLYKEWDELIGMELYNKGDMYPARELWDEVLTSLVPTGRFVWGFSNDDMHHTGQLGRNWHVMLMPELSSESLRRAMQEGAFFYVYAPKGHEGPPPPEIKSITVDMDKGIISIEATGHDKIEWICKGVGIHHGDTLDLLAHRHVQGYVRAVVHAAEGGAIIGTQPFGLE